jgi:hypothetical protein
MMARFRTAPAGWWSRSIVSRWRALPHNARLASVVGVLLIVVLVAAGIAVKSQPSASQPSPSVWQAPTSVVAEASSPGATSSTPSSIHPDYSSWPTGWITSPPTDPPATPSPTPIAPITTATLATFPCKPYTDDPVDLAVSGGLLYLYCKAPGDKSTASVVAIDLSTNRIVRTYDFEFVFDPSACTMGYCEWSTELTLAVDHGLWVGSHDMYGGIERLDLATGQATLGHNGWQFLAHSPGRIWVAIPQSEETDDMAIKALNPSTGKATSDPGFHSGDPNPGVGVCAAMVFAEVVRDGQLTLELLTPTRSPGWQVEASGFDWITVGQADGGCWLAATSASVSSFQLARLGLDGVEAETDLIKRDWDVDSEDVRFYDGQAWLVRVTAQGTYIQRLTLPSRQLLGRPMRVPSNWLGIAAGSIWARNTQGYLVRLGLNGATPAPRTPSPKPTLGRTATPTVAPTQTAGPSS